MSNGLYFSLDNLPERYRTQVAQKIAQEGKRVNTQAKAKNGAEVPSRASCGGDKGKASKKREKKRYCAPIRMSKNSVSPNKTEAQFNRDVLLGGGKYEAITLNLKGGVKYTPDWVFEDDGGIYFVEIKGSYKLPTHGRSVMAFKVACSEFPMFTFLFAELGKDGKTWNIGAYKDGVEITSVRGTAQQLREME